MRTTAVPQGTIPIYLGAPNGHEYDPGLAAGVHPAMIHASDFASLAQLVRHVQQLLADEVAYNRC